MSEQSWEKMYDAYYMRVYSFTMTLCGDKNLAEDVTQETFSRAMSKSASFRIHMALHALEEPYREAFELRVFGELSFREIGTIFGKTENWARVTYHRARLKLQERMNADEN